jgi:hypothetical protein
MKDVAFVTALMAFGLAGLGVPGWGWFLFVALVFGMVA